MGRAIKFLFSVVIVVFIAAFYALLNIDLNDYKQQIEKATHDATGRELSLEGDVSLTWSLIPTLQVEKARFSNAGWASDADMLALDKLEVRLALWPLLKREIQVTKILLNQPVISLETNDKGVGNWEFPQQAAPEEPEEQGESAIQSVIVNILDIREAKISYADGSTGQTQQFDIEKLSIEAANLTKPMDVVFKAELDELPVSLEGELGGLQALIDNRKTLVDLDAEVSGVGIKLSGDIARPHVGKGMALDLAVETDDETIAGLLGPDSELPAFGSVKLQGHVANDIKSEAVKLDLTTLLSGLELMVKGQIAEPQNVAGIDLTLDLKTSSEAIAALSESAVPPVGDISLTGSVRGDQKALTVSDLLLTAGESDVSGEIALAMGEEKPSIEMTLRSTLLDLTPLSEGEAESVEEAPASDKLFSDDPLVLDGLKQLNAKINFDAKTVQSTGATMQDVSVKVDLTDGHLKVLPLTARFAGSQVDAKFDLDAREETAVLATQLQINGFKLNKITALQEAIEGGNTDVFFEARGEGDSVKALMAGLNGKAVAKVAESQIADGTLDILGADFIGELVNLLNPFAKEKAGTELACAVVNFKIRNGIATADKGIAVRTGKMNIVGDGTINLRNEKIDIGITPEARTGIGVSMTDLVGLVRVGGTLAEPSALVDKAAVLEAGLSTGAAVATGGLSVVAEGLVDRATADTNPCETALGIKKPVEKPAE